jgi:hypothetical protein
MKKGDNFVIVTDSFFFRRIVIDLCKKSTLVATCRIMTIQTGLSVKTLQVPYEPDTKHPSNSY